MNSKIKYITDFLDYVFGKCQRGCIVGIFLFSFLILQSCELNVNEIEESFSDNEFSFDENEYNNSVVSYTFLMAQVNLTISPQATGNVILELRNDLGELITSASRPINGMASKGKPTWYSFQSFTAFNYQPLTRLRLYLRRSDAHNEATSNTVYISMSDGDDYSGGNSSLTGRDISFITYKTITDSEKPGRKNYLDQLQTKVRERLPVLNNEYVWQEFYFGNSTSNAQVELLKKVNIPLTNYAVQSGSFVLQITNTQGNIIVEEVSIPASQIQIGNNIRFEFVLPSPLIVSFGQRYRFQIQHICDLSDWTVPIFVGHTEVDAYRLGMCSLGGDLAFRTYLLSEDQMQETITTLKPINANFIIWQEFVPGIN